MKPIQSYLQAAASRGEAYSNASGYGYRHGDGGGYAANLPAKNTKPSWASAGGSSAMNSIGDAPVSDPYIITVTAGTTVTTGTVVNIFFANSALGGFQYSTADLALANASGPGWYRGTYYPATNISISTAFANYQQLLQQSQTKPFQIGKTLLIAAAGNNIPLQVSSPIIYSEQYANGSQANKPLIFVYDISQQIQTQTVNKNTYTIDGNTQLAFTLQSSTGTASVTSLYVYPTIEVNTSAALTGNTVVNSYSAPTSPLSAVMIR